jgi:hypothetical protein
MKTSVVSSEESLLKKFPEGFMNNSFCMVTIERHGLAILQCVGQWLPAAVLQHSGVLGKKSAVMVVLSGLAGSAYEFACSPVWQMMTVIKVCLAVNVKILLIHITLSLIAMLKKKWSWITSLWVGCLAKKLQCMGWNLFSYIVEKLCEYKLLFLQFIHGLNMQW